MINGLLAVVCLLAAGFCFWKFQSTPDGGTLFMVAAVILALLTAVFGVMFLSGRVNKSEDIHITE